MQYSEEDFQILTPLHTKVDALWKIVIDTKYCKKIRSKKKYDDMHEVFVLGVARFSPVLNM